MGSMNFNIDSGFIRQLEKMGDTENLIPKIIEETTPIVENSLKGALRKHKRTGSMINSIKATKVKKNQNGYYAVVRPTGKDENGVRNIEKMVYSEYGTSKQKADPVQKQVINETENAINEKAQEIFNREVGL